MKPAVFGLGVGLLLAGGRAAADDAPQKDEPCAEKAEKDPEKDKPACSCDTRSKPKVKLSVTGVRPSMTRVATGGSAPTTDVGVAFAGAFDSYALDGSAHGQVQWVLGGGQAGFEGMLAGVMEGGYRINVTERQGPFGRAGFDGRIQGNDRLYFSALELPRVTLGYQLLSGRAILEIGARGGPILTGRFNPGNDGVRSLAGSFEYGGFTSAQFEFVRLEATAMRYDARRTGDRSPVDVGRAVLCGMGGKVAICADFTVFRGTANMGPRHGMQDALATYAGVTAGIASW